MKISVGSEMAAMLRPDQNWVTNVRTVYSSLLLRHQGYVIRANEELSLYRDQDRDSEMDYAIWRDFHQHLGDDLLQLATLGNRVAATQEIEPGGISFLWADAIANELYVQYAHY